ncbi:hypothetical protein N781_04060 [Pontibacillus halophilus JSM 076056 = DSM 19796]|uniref:Spore germination protein n=1 Tax=Pontibacillus halophilus JSM 076056 = DSM 19796 TaxID=1385510 RepID=A0A0A5GKK7_9BACI|nr:spore morphogenesis/germination protein YwcE [Pontibacillus halophilus]KGX91700.1 hypothetical protein N781_04060 [Pontibacillus halophilus JSM 076056 = DSM 19796]
MDILAVYLILASVTPLFLWKSYPKSALGHIPFIGAMWAYYIIVYTSVSAPPFLSGLLLTMFIISLVYAHVGIYMVLIHDPFVRKRLRSNPDIYENRYH